MGHCACDLDSVRQESGDDWPAFVGDNRPWRRPLTFSA
jgi:hypothetical protein